MDNKTMIKVINGMSDKIDALENNINKCFNKFDKIDDRIDDLETWKYKLNDMDKILLNRIEALEDKVSNHFITNMMI